MGQASFELTLAQADLDLQPPVTEIPGYYSKYYSSDIKCWANK